MWDTTGLLVKWPRGEAVAIAQRPQRGQLLLPHEPWACSSAREKAALCEGLKRRCLSTLIFIVDIAACTISGEPFTGATHF